MKNSINRVLAVINVVFVICGFVFFVPTFAVSGKAMERALASNDIEKLGSLVKQMYESQASYGLIFLLCFVLLAMSAIFLWRKNNK